MAYAFELSGGALALDFANTLSDRGPTGEEHLSVYRDLVAWSRQARVLGNAGARRLARGAARRPAAARAALNRATRLRECLYRMFSAVARGRRPVSRDLQALNAALGRSWRRLRLAQRAHGFHWTWSGEGAAFDRMLGPVARSAADLLTSSERERVRECAAHTCSWLFVDRSRTHRRRWCSMSTCGNRDKVRRYYERRRGKRD